MIPRPIWTGRIAAAHRATPIAWLTGVRRVGKTTLARALPGALYLNCDLPSTAERLRDPERFLASVEAPLLVLDVRGLKAMRATHPAGRNFLATPMAGAPYDREWGGLIVRVVHAAHLRSELASPGEGPRR